MKARLYTTTARFEHNPLPQEYEVDEKNFVSEVEVLTYNRPPDILVWGNRFFANTNITHPDSLAVCYREAFVAMTIQHQGPQPGVAPSPEPELKS